MIQRQPTVPSENKLVSMIELGAREITSSQTVAEVRVDRGDGLDEYLGLFSPEMFKFVVFDRFLVPFTFSTGGCAVGLR